jgi:hypothetical protein
MPKLEIMHGGPFFEMQRRAGLIRASGFRTAVRSLLLIAITFIMPVLVAALSREGNLGAFLADPGVWAKFLAAPLLFIMAEPRIEGSIDRCIGALSSTPLISSKGLPFFNASLKTATFRRDSATAELLCAILAVVVTAINIWALSVSTSTAHWASDGASPTPAGWLCLLVGNTLFWFLLFRLVWRHLVWTMFAHAIAKSELRLVASHPDGHAGLSFMTLYPSGYTFFSLGVGSVVAAGLARQLHSGALTLTAFTAVCTIWLVVVAVFFALPLAGPVLQIFRLKSETIALTLGPMQEFERAAERKALGRNAFADEPVSEGSAPADAKATYQAAVKCSGMLLNKSNVVPILAGALLPIAAVGLTVFPYAELGPVLKRLLLL